MNPGYQRHLEWVKQRRAALAETLAAMYPNPIRLTLEIGCGHGHWLADFAANFPQRECLGVDLIGDRLHRATRKAERAGALNARFLRGEAFEVLDLMPAHVSLEEVFILFPDPWPKKRHWKNRLFCLGFLDELGKRCTAGVRCHFRTDHDPYFTWTLEVVDQQKDWERDATADWPFERATVFQNRAETYQSLSIVKR